MNFEKKSLWICALLTLVSAAASADNGPASRPATKADLVGVWDLVSVRPVYDKKDPVFFPYQRFVFKADSSMKTMVSTEPFSKEWLAKFEKQSSEIDYTVSDKGLLTLIWQNRPHSETAVCAFVLKGVPPEVLAKVPPGERNSLPKKGNIALSFLNSEGKIAYRKILAKIA